MSYVLKRFPKDFIVEEISDLHLLESGPYTCFQLQKTDMNTLDAIHLLSKSLQVPLEHFGYAGTKDKKAMTSQFVTVKGDYRKAIDSLQNAQVKTSFKGYMAEPLHLGELLGNHFTITVRKVTKKPKPMFVYVNFYGEQRFGKHNASIGKHIVLKDFEHACLLLLETNTRYKPILIDYLEKHPRDYVGAMRRLPLKLLRLFVHAYQSKLWNEIAQEMVQKKAIVSNVQIPLVGFGLSKNTKYKDHIFPKLEREQVRPEDFIIKQIPELSSEGGFRRVFTDVKDLHIGDLEPDENMEDEHKIRLSFQLRPGCYATVFIHQLFGKFGDCSTQDG